MLGDRTSGATHSPTRPLRRRVCDRDQFVRPLVLDVRKGQKLIFHFDGDGPLYGTVDCRGGDGPFSDGFEFVVPQSGACVVSIEISRMADRWSGSFWMTITAK